MLASRYDKQVKNLTIVSVVTHDMKAHLQPRGIARRGTVFIYEISAVFESQPTHQEVANIKRWADNNLMKLNMKNTFQMVFKDKTRMPLQEYMDGIARKSELKLLGVTINEDPYACNWDTQFENMLSNASSRLYILRVCKYYGYSLQELTLLYDSLIMSLFTYAIEEKKKKKKNLTDNCQIAEILTDKKKDRK